MGRSENETETETYNKVSRRVRRVELCCVVWWRVSSEVFVGTVRSGVDERVREKEETGGFPSLHFCVICFMERLLQINIIGIHRRVLSPDEAPCAPGLLHFFTTTTVTAAATATTTTTTPSIPQAASPTMTATTTPTSTLATSTYRTRGSAGSHASSRFYYPRFLEFFQWRPALFHGLSLLYAYILPSEGSTAELYTLPPLTATLVLCVSRGGRLPHVYAQGASKVVRFLLNVAYMCRHREQ
ncbi:hypothetical protein ALC60_03258 [Trachymyrmex zeteki]|uniref:Uncharacterized protein n=1 Tax=Mycetomoellerius zeteki TaxID=64791 RepID=A0A151XBL6_9HYME|nr:hypothetical protein ALC60_03258 [Trachymyrmex zeteki]